MKKSRYWYAAVAAIFLIFIQTRFGHFAIDGTSIWQEMAWLKLVPFTYLFCLFLYQTLEEAQAGGWTGYVYKNGVSKIETDNKKVKFWQATYFRYTVICLAFELIIFLVSLGDR